MTGANNSDEASKGSLPGIVLSADQLGHDPERTAFEAWASNDMRWPLAVERSGNGYRMMSTHAAWFAWRPAWAASAAAERGRCLRIIEAHQVPVGNSAAGEMAAEWTMEALREVRDAIRGA